MYDALTLLADADKLSIVNHGDLRIRDSAACLAAFTSVGERAMKEKRVLAGVFVHCPLSFAIVFTPAGSVVVFDSHAQSNGSEGAMIAVLRHRCSWASAVQFVESMFGRQKLQDGHYCLLEVI